jgi:hypothetical protein
VLNIQRLSTHVVTGTNPRQEAVAVVERPLHLMSGLTSHWAVTVGHSLSYRSLLMGDKRLEVEDDPLFGMDVSL